MLTTLYPEENSLFIFADKPVSKCTKNYKTDILDLNINSQNNNNPTIEDVCIL